MVRVKEDNLRRLCLDILRAAGAPQSEAEIVSDILVATSLRGVDSHGVRLLPGNIEKIKSGALRPDAVVRILRETETTAMLDDGSGFGFVAAKKAMQMAIDKAKRYKLGSVGLTGPGHVGALYYYSLMAAKNDMIGISMCRGGSHGTAPYGGVEGRLGSNPLSYAIPAGSRRPIVLDMATTGVAMAHLDVMAARGQQAPEGWLIKSDGTWSNDPTGFRTQTAVPVAFGYPHSEYKGYGLSVIVEALAGAIGCGCSLDETGFGHVFTAIDPTGYCSIDQFKARIDSMIDHIKSSEKRPGVREIFLPGELEWIEGEKRRKEGILVDEEFWTQIQACARGLGLDPEAVINQAPSHSS